MSVLDPRELEASPLADLHALAAELGLEGYRRLRKEELIKQLVASTGADPETQLWEDAAAEPEGVVDPGEPDVAPQVEPVEEAPEPRKRRGRRLRKAEPEPEPEPVAAVEDEDADVPEEDDSDDSAAVAVRDEDDREERDDRDERAEDEEHEEDIRSGVLDVLPNGSGFLRAEPYRQSREDVYVSPAQIRRCELRPGDEVAGPARPPRRNERHPSLVRVATVNGQDADAPAERPRFESLTAVWPTERLGGPSTLADAPFGKGSRVAVGGPPGAGATWLLREAVKVLRDRHSDLEVIVVLAGVRPEEAVEWSDAGIEVAGGSFDGSFDEQAQTADLAVQQAKRAVEAGRDAVVVIDSLDALPPAAARRVFGAGRNTKEAGSLTILASTGTAAEPHRMATTHVTLEPSESGGEPKLGPGSGTLRRDLLG
jgi:transcription termination factor Rho